MSRQGGAQLEDGPGIRGRSGEGGCPGCAGRLDVEMSPGAEVIREAIAAFNAGDVGAYFRRHTATTTLEQPDGTVIDREVYEARTVSSRARWPSLYVRIVRLHDAGATVVMESTVDLGDGGPERPEAVIFDLSADGLIERTRIYARGSIEMTLGEFSD